MVLCKHFKQKESLAPGVVLVFADETCCNCSKFVGPECLEYLERVKREKVRRLLEEFGW